MPEIGKLLVTIGVAIAVFGLALWSGFGAGWLAWIIISSVLSLIISFFRR